MCSSEGNLNFMRTIAREELTKLTFEFLFTNKIDDIALEEACAIKGLTAGDVSYIKSSISELVEKHLEIEKIVKDNLKDFSYTQIFKMDLAILFVSVYEIKFLKTPYQVVINEALNLAKKYSTEKSSSFINGVLSSVIK